MKKTVGGNCYKTIQLWLHAPASFISDWANLYAINRSWNWFTTQGLPSSPLTKAINSLSPCRVAYHSAFIVHLIQQTAYTSRSFLIIKFIYQIMKLVRWLMTT